MECRQMEVLSREVRLDDHGLCSCAFYQLPAPRNRVQWRYLDVASHFEVTTAVAVLPAIRRRPSDNFAAVRTVLSTQRNPTTMLHTSDFVDLISHRLLQAQSVWGQ
jgi:hypothetical protein